MPRTKAVKKKPAEKTSKFAQTYLPIVENYRQQTILKMEQEMDSFLSQVHTQLMKSQMSIPAKLANKTIGEVKELPLDWSANSTSASIVQILDVTKTRTEKKKRVLRSSSCCEDEGYLTTESSKSTSGGRQSRARSRIQKTLRVSRSASTRQANRTIKSDERFKTPANKIVPATFGTVTPKMKPNTPQVLLRRPKLGEVALSMQGSPLLTGAVMTDNVANINIPLDDGRLLSIQPKRGLRISQIPELDIETKRQLETLRDNLNKMCALSGKR
ncbi:borealin isoform X1 [Zophobas morio]|uniref:borealin isoform X1 n=1 Tax=Zophobas morio TaxID=2755281 RepID=UPI003082ECF4